MAEDKTIDIIKGAILLEHRGKALYESVVKTTKNKGLIGLFSFLAGEEENHIKLLNQQYKNVSKGIGFKLNGRDGHAETSNFVLSRDIIAGISGAGYEAAVISAALDFEKRAVQYYSEHAEKAGSEDEKKLYRWFADWETGHMRMLAELDKELKEKIWHDNSFWPLD